MSMETEQPAQDLILVDAYSQIFRGFYAVSHLSSHDGTPTNAVFVFGRILLKLCREYPSGLGALVFDCGRVKFREELNPLYKKNRPPMPDELKIQIPYIRELAQYFGWPLLEEPEYEADDLIAALAVSCPGTVRIVSSDKDLAQLVNERVSMLVPGFGGGFELRDYAGVLKKFAVPPEKIIDYLSLTGDSADNIEGIAGVGPKTAAKLLGEFESVEAILAHPEALANEKLREKIVAGSELLRRNRKLISLRLDLPERWKSEEMLRRREPDWAAIRSMLLQLDLHSLRRELDAAEKSAGKAAADAGTEKSGADDAAVQGEFDF